MKIHRCRIHARLRWANDGNGLLLSSWRPVWLFPFDGAPRIVADFCDTTWGFDVSPDHSLFVSRGRSRATRCRSRISGRGAAHALLDFAHEKLYLNRFRLKVSEETKMREWRLAKVWLLRELGKKRLDA